MSLPEPMTLPCGCFINPIYENGEPTLSFSPCKPTCVHLRDLLAEAEAQAKPVEFRQGP